MHFLAFTDFFVVHEPGPVPIPIAFASFKVAVDASVGKSLWKGSIPFGHADCLATTVNMAN